MANSPKGEAQENIQNAAEAPAPKEAAGKKTAMKKVTAKQDLRVANKNGCVFQLYANEPRILNEKRAFDAQAVGGEAEVEVTIENA